MHGRKFGGRVVEAVLMGEHDYKEVRLGMHVGRGDVLAVRSGEEPSSAWDQSVQPTR